MKLGAKEIPFSSIVGGGLALVDERGAYRFQLAIMGTTQGITREQSQAIAEQVTRLINANNLDVPERKD